MVKIWERSQAYRLAAGVYFFYGAVYLYGAIQALDPSRQRSFFGGMVPWWIFYVLGGLVLLSFPVLIWKEYKWFSRILLLGPLGKLIALGYEQSKSLSNSETPSLYNWFFMAMALLAAIFLFRASWLPPKKEIL